MKNNLKTFPSIVYHYCFIPTVLTMKITYVTITKVVADITINIDIQIHRWKNQLETTCTEGRMHILSSLSAADHCETSYSYKVCKCKNLAEAVITETDLPKDLHQYQVFHFSNNSINFSTSMSKPCVSSTVAEDLCEIDLNSKYCIFTISASEKYSILAQYGYILSLKLLKILIQSSKYI